MAFFKKKNDLKPHQYKGWLNSRDKTDCPEEFEQKAKIVCGIYQNAIEYEAQGIHVLSVDEKTGIQALEHIHSAKPMQPGSVEKIEQEYVRNGTTGIITSLNVATGKIIAPLIQGTRNELDFVRHISDVIALAPQDKYIFILDQLNIHKSESIVRFIAQHEGISETELGEKGKSGILKSMETRANFLMDVTHAIRFVFTPKHSSWLNQIEIWFSIISRKILNKRASFSSVKELESIIRKFIDFYNQFLAKPFKWTYSGKLLHK